MTEQEPKEPRKATDVLLDIEKKLDNLTKMVVNNDMLVKLMADRANKTYDMTTKIYSYIEELKQEYIAAQGGNSQSSENQDAQVINSPPVEQIVMDAPFDQPGDRRGARTPQRQEPVLAAPNTIQEQPQQSEGRKIPVVQRVSDNTGKDLYLATVVISDEQGKQVLKTKTSTAGKWQALLKPASYMVHISKTDTVSKKVFEGTQKITIPNSNSTFTLPVVIIKRDA